jgi:DNA-binding NarL/FixJ family response regulator
MPANDPDSPPGRENTLPDTFSDDEYIVRALKIGAKGYILKQDFEGIIPALNAVDAGKAFFRGGLGAKIPVLRPGKEDEPAGSRHHEKGGVDHRLIAECLSNARSREGII